jgi:2-polyprenyl-3-methyl-5-hydroxy-6-metoxy-1,4-benzoquinol methylase
MPDNQTMTIKSAHLKTQKYYKNYFLEETGNTRYIDRELLVKKYVHGNIILDLGCGQGKMGTLLKKHRLYGIDIEKESAKQAKLKNYYQTVALDFDHHKLPFNSSFFDTVFSMEVIEHLFDPIGILNEVNRVLKKKGTLLISVPNIAWLPNRLFLLFGIFTDSQDVQLVPSHIRFFTLKRMNYLLFNTGFKITKVIGTTDFVTPTIGSKVINLLARSFPTLFGYNLFFVCEKISSPQITNNTYKRSIGLIQALNNVLRFR